MIGLSWNVKKPRSRLFDAVRERMSASVIFCSFTRIPALASWSFIWIATCSSNQNTAAYSSVMSMPSG